MRVVLQYPYIRTAYSSEQRLSLRIGKSLKIRKPTLEADATKRREYSAASERRQTANIRSTRPVIVREVLPNAENEKNTKSKPGSPSISRDPAPLCYDFKSENLRSKLRRMPLLRALPPLAAGILLADHYVLPLWLFVGEIPRLRYPGTARRRPGRKPRHPGSHSAFRHDRHRTETHFRSADRHSGRMRNHRPRKRSPNGKAKRPAAQRSAPGGTPRPGEWLPAAGNLVVRCDSSTALNPGDRAVVRGKIYPFTARHGGYGRLMTRRGYVGTPLPEPLKPAAARHPAPGASPRSTSPCSCTNGPSHGSTVWPWHPTNRPSATL